MALPLPARFERVVRLTVDRGFLACSGPLMARAQISVLDSTGNELGRSPAAALSHRPTWGWSMWIHLPAHNITSELRLRLADALTHKFLGEGRLMLMEQHGYEGAPFQIMLEPRSGAGANGIDPTDDDTLQQLRVDDYGYVTGSVAVNTLPTVPDPSALKRLSGTTANVKFPIGCCIRARLLVESTPTTTGTVFATFGNGPGEYPIMSATPLFVSVGSAGDAVVSLRCTVDGSTEGRSRLFLPLHAIGSTLDVALPVTRKGDPANGSVLAVLLVTYALQPSPSFPSDTPPAASTAFNRAPPELPLGLFAAASWESEAHVARATERRWRRSLAVDAAPQKDHLRHLFDVLAGKSELSTSMVPLVRAFFNLTPSGATVTCDLRQLLCALAFSCHGITPVDAALFVFEIISTASTNAEPAAAAPLVGLPELCFLLEHCLLPKTLDMSIGDIRRRCADLICLWAAEGYRTDAGAIMFPIHVFAQMVARNLGLWAVLGCTLEAPGPSAAVQLHQAPSDAAADASWRTMIVKVPAIKKAFAVTAHVDDTFGHVARQIQDSINIAAAKQQMIIDRTLVDAETRVGALVPASTQVEVIVSERDDNVRLVLVYRAKNMKWDVAFPAKEKILRLRALVQQHTNIPLSRITLTLGGTALSDRHPASHYGVFDGVVIDVASSA